MRKKTYRRKSITPAAVHMMGITRCLVCNLPTKQRERADAKLVDGTSLGSVAEEFGISKASVARHARNHLLKKDKAEKQTEITDIVPASPVAEAPLDSLVELERLYRAAGHQLKRAEQQGNVVIARALRSECRQLLELRAKLKGELQKKPSEPDSPRIIVVQGRADQFPASKTKRAEMPDEPVQEIPGGVVLDLKR
jgi:hypothetical protein